MKKNKTSKQISATDPQKCLPEEKLTKQSKELTEVEGNLLPGDDLTSLTSEEREIRLRTAKKALYKVLLDRARALVDANPSAFTKIH